MSAADEYGFNIPGLDWQDYETHRPKYPATLFHRIFKYHEDHEGKFDVAHDAGAGAGVASAVLAQRFATVHASDPNPTYVATAKKRFVDTAKVKVVEASAEDQQWLSPDSVDLFGMFTAIHWTDVSKVFEQLEKTLKPSGTFVAINYSVFPAIINNAAAHTAWTAYFEDWVGSVLQMPSAMMQRAVRYGVIGFDIIKVPKSFKDVIRIKINDGARGENDIVAHFPQLRAVPSQVGQDDTLLNEQNAEEWTRDCSIDDLRNFLHTMQDTPSQETEDEVLRQVGQAMEAAGQTEVTLRWSCQVLLASKR